MPFIPHTENDIQAMLSTIGVKKIDDLFDEIASEIPTTQLHNMPEGLSESDAIRLLSDRAPLVKPGFNFLGAGAYDHFIPAAVWDLVTRGEFYTAYTPYQPEASQGTLEVIFEYQSMMTELMNMEVSNASLYDGASALVEAVLMALRIQKNSSKKILVPYNLHPHYRDVLKSILRYHAIELVQWHYDEKSGLVDLSQLQKINSDEFAAIIISQPNFFGCIEAVDAITNLAHEKKAYVIGVVNPLAMSLLKSPGTWGDTGADIVCGEGQPLGVPLAGGGPYFGFLCCRKKDIRQLPGRIVGKTNDAQGRPGFVLTLQAREQHIRRAKATSNICTNQGLLVTAATIYMRMLGGKGLNAIAKKCVEQADTLKKLLSKVDGLSFEFDAPTFHEFVIHLHRPVDEIIEKLQDYGLQPGLSLNQYYDELKNNLLICVTETKTLRDLEHYRECLVKVN
ncbi:MAG: aminomethyl-transferring glycine dehydrogenase [Gammaproteobacteria bacterium CG_4_10_14_0_8_um_filter_38_16]|nr:MAG: aminomethyl-transferring glycine dehydrogenase [Gammaproteobacteria bacterium CG_4_10_14_0_8_um_filter_38_16]PJA03894.1 MAG: aminomethyl-transferring glycine dehydrogenase [Gammaproteobacteria bacterium CG_4_10_14_0_2_um_filter_38_22]PJB09563.1 MAG: aminomethyl-transferring glycine dehydrogenase [Gammaproteobacteria bacterium CG_4_9_14_3_um_filter_38_9]